MTYLKQFFLKQFLLLKVAVKLSPSADDLTYSPAFRQGILVLGSTSALTSSGFPSKAEVHLSPSVPPFGAVPFCPKVLLNQQKTLNRFFSRSAIGFLERLITLASDFSLAQSRCTRH